MKKYNSIVIKLKNKKLIKEVKNFNSKMSLSLRNLNKFDLYYNLGFYPSRLKLLPIYEKVIKKNSNLKFSIQGKQISLNNLNKEISSNIFKEFVEEEYFSYKLIFIEEGLNLKKIYKISKKAFKENKRLKMVDKDLSHLIKKYSSELIKFKIREESIRNEL